MASKRKLVKRIKMELWVMSQVGIPKSYKITSRAIQHVRVGGLTLTIGELRAILDALER